MIKAIIFDFDQVILNSYPDHLAAFITTARKFGIKLNPKEVYKKFGKSAKDILQELAPSLSDKEIEKFSEEKEKIYRLMAKKNGFKLMPGAKQILRSLVRKKIKCAISSSASGKNILLAANHTGIKKYFSATVAAEEHRNVDAVDGGLRTLDAVADSDEAWPQGREHRIAVEVMRFG